MEEPIMDFRQASDSGYTQSKLVGEYIVQTAVEDFGAIACNLRIGQVVGDTKLGLWNENEAPPLMIRSALTLGKLPALDMVCTPETLCLVMRAKQFFLSHAHGYRLILWRRPS